MKKLIFLFLSILNLSISFADEGMWLPMLLKNNYDEMQKKGLKLTPEQLYDINQSSLKDAIVWFNGGCTAEIITDKGLILTNHHCGYGAITNHSTPSDNILDNGFWAKAFTEEKVNSGLWVSILVRMEDVSEMVNNAIESADADSIEIKKTEIFESIEKEAAKNTHYEATVKSFFKDNAFYLFVFEKFTDIRLVGTPPQSIGKFGGDTDNWMWPRHNADFSMFRIYANKDNKPADYSKDNVPYQPKHFLTISLKGVNEGDFTMVYGFPGRTNRYENSYGIKLATDKINPAIVALRDIRLSNWKEEMNKSDSVRLLLSANYARVANYWKYFMGQTEQLKRLKVYEEKFALEQQFNEWAKNKPDYASIFPNLEKAYTSFNKYALHMTYMQEGIFGSAILAYANQYKDLEKLLTEKADPEKIKNEVEKLKENAWHFFKSFNGKAEEKILAGLTQSFYENIATEQQPAYMIEIIKKYKGKTTKETFENFANSVFKKSFMVSKSSTDKFLRTPALKKLQKDPAYVFIKVFFDNYAKIIKPHIEEFNRINNAEGKKYIKALMEMEPEKNFYPDANRTLRVTYGKVESYSPKDAVNYKYYTTLSGVMEKENPNDFEFTLPSRLKELYEKKDFGVYADQNGEMRTDFISNNDITGGNSGSPVLNGNGELIGLAFDGNWEAMSGDLYFDSKYKRTISCDIRYILFLVDKFGEAHNLISEMKILKTKESKVK